MARKTQAEYVTIKGRLKFDNKEDKAILFYTMRVFKESVERAYVLLKKGVEDKDIMRKITRFINNGHYALSALKQAKKYEAQDRLKLRKPQLYSIGRACEKGNRNIRLIDTNRVLVKIPHADGRHRWLELRVRFGRRYLPLVKEIVDLASRGELPYGATIAFN